MQLENEASQNNFWKNILEWNLTTKKISGNNSYTSRTRYQKPNTHLNVKLQQRHPKVPEGSD